ncbi:MAG: EAL domain-containing protein [Candidatus Accumulibacter sp.]|uniref:putative bifunctional diguanylate cyclase/phosphodiesterase n=1 Tax=Accumulibacter sp. TaxID=2053492 RepID=UPI001DDC8CB4|nr:EAL domain-containing protein [Accumulibacter sp.]MCB1942100.1 EAL domain-containing protein [Accumulibacter sp.]MCP5248121.1 EAL domain-containing protein [Accumulibacter sp.]
MNSLQAIPDSSRDGLVPSDFELAVQLHAALLDHQDESSGDAVAAVIAQALASDHARFVLAEQAAGVGGIWRELFAEAARRGAVVRRRSVVGGRSLEHLALPLLGDGQALGFMGAAASEGAFEEQGVGRFTDLGALLTSLLQARRRQQLSAAALTASAAQIGRQARLLDLVRDALITIDLDGHITGWNPGAEAVFGYAAAEVIGRHVRLLHAEDDEELFGHCAEGKERAITVRRKKKSGEIFSASVTLLATVDQNGVCDGYVGSVIDLSNQLAAEERLRLDARIFERNNEAVLVTDAEEKIISSNLAFSSITGYEADEVLGQSPAMLFRQPGEAWLRPLICDEIARGGEWRGELQFRRKNGETFPGSTAIGSVRDAGGKLRNHFFVFSDLSERKKAERTIHHLAYYDALTGLANRSLFHSLLEQALSAALRKRSHGALLFVDLNRFKHINDSFGHTQADSILKEVARRLSVALREEDIVARLGGDEFVVALPEISRREHAGHVAKKVLASLAEPFFLEGHEILLSASIGISIFPADGRNVETLLKNADVAMVRAKKRGSSSHLFYSQEMNLRSFEQLKLEGGLRRAIARGEFHLVYQPQVDLRSGRITGAEALLRWQHPEDGLIPPAQFIPVAEETGLINPIGEWVINAACSQIREWIDRGLPCVHVAVNLSARQFSASLPRKVVGLLARHAIPRSFLELEITESMLMHSADSVVAMMREFGEAGVLMTLDDFGTGYSSLSYLKRFPIDNLKIDQSFVRGVPGDKDDSAIARTIISMAKNLGLSVIAEGVETAAQMEFLRDAGCEEMQGYYFSRPLPAAEFADLLVRTNQ